MSSSTIDASIDDLRWPQCCCRCGAQSFSIRTHVENVVTWTVVAVTSYQRVAIPIPVCSRCFRRRTVWYGSAAATCAALFGALSQWGDRAYAGQAAAVMGLGIVYMLWRGLDAQPVRLLALATQTRTLTLKVYLPRTAEALLQAPGARPGTWKAVRRPLVYALVGVWLSAICIGLASRYLH